MQAEKYLFHFSKWGVEGEKALNARYAATLPAGMELQISIPEAISIRWPHQIGWTKTIGRYGASGLTAWVPAYAESRS